MNSSETHQKFSVKKILESKLGKYILTWVLIIAILPAMTISFIDYQISSNSIRAEVEYYLKETSNLISERILSFFVERETDLRLLTESKRSVDLIEKFSGEYKKSGLELPDYVKSDTWRKIVETDCEDLKNINDKVGYYDIFLIDLSGNILYSVMEEKDMGTNLFTGEFSNTKFSKAVSECLETGRMTFSDFEFYVPSDNAAAGFIVQIIKDEKGRQKGLIAFQFAQDEIDQIVTSKSKNFNSFDSYMIGSDLVMRSNSLLDTASSMLREVVNTDLTESWQSQFVNYTADNVPFEIIKEYTGRRGNTVFGINKSLSISGITFGIVIEVDKTEVFAPLDNMRLIVIWGLIFFTTVVVVMSVNFTKKVVAPITQITEWGKQLALGEIVTQKITAPDNEIGKLVEIFGQIADSSGKIALQADNIAKGEFQFVVEARSKNDILGNSLKEMTESLQEISRAVESVADGHLEVTVDEKSEKDLLGKSINKMTANLKETIENNQLQLWYSKGLSEVSKIMREESEVSRIVSRVCGFLAKYLDCQILALYLAEDMRSSKNRKLQLAGGYALSKENHIDNVLEFGEGIAGQAAVEKEIITVNNLPEESKLINSSLINVKPQSLVAVPLRYGERVIGVLELGSVNVFEETKLNFLGKLIYLLGISFNTLVSNIKVQELLRKTEQQQEELKVSNEELEERSRQLDEQNKSIEEKNKSLLTAAEELKKNAEQLEVTSRYKSEFLANMSHELRTPLNSLLLLAQSLSKNKDGNLTEKQIKNIRIIYNGGKDLLNMINEILDLSKIESGKMDVLVENINVHKLKSDVSDVFDHLVEKKGLEFSIDIKEGVKDTIKSDRQKLFQIIKNLISNALKFTHEGGIEVSISKLTKDEKLPAENMDYETTLAIAVKDSGIGIPENKQLEVFEAFQQADGSTSRQYGGTGLGLSISREMARLLGGEITLQSKVGEGSVFTLYINDNLSDKISSTSVEADSEKPVVSQSVQTQQETVQSVPDIHIADDRDNLSPEDFVVLGIEDDLKFADILCSLCKDNGYKFIHAADGKTGFELAKELKPNGIFLDVNLPVMNGLEVLEKIKNDTELLHIPLYVMSVNERPAELLKKGVTGFLPKPVEIRDLELALKKVEAKKGNKTNKVLLVQNEKDVHSVTKELEEAGLKVKAFSKGKSGLEFLKNEEFDLMIFDWELSDIYGSELLKEVKKQNEFLPVIVYSEYKLNEKDNDLATVLASQFVIRKGGSHQELLEKVSFFIKTGKTFEIRKEEDVPEDNEILKSKTVLLVDDDIRNLYSLEEEFLELEMNVIKATDGKMSIETLKSNNNIDIVLMDIMMPVMNGYEAMQEIRKTSEIESVPIIAVTAKAMKEDRDKCIQAGADDYISKPVDIDELIKLMKMWIKN
ncbi:MAG: response regulator [Rhodothermaceae bacterium]